MLSLDTAYRSFGGEVEASSTPTICRLSDSRRHQLSAIALPRAPLDTGSNSFPLPDHFNCTAVIHISNLQNIKLSWRGVASSALKSYFLDLAIFYPLRLMGSDGSKSA